MASNPLMEFTTEKYGEKNFNSIIDYQKKQNS